MVRRHGTTGAEPKLTEPMIARAGFARGVCFARERSMTCRSACATASGGSAGRPRGQRPPPERHSRGARNACREAHRPRVALRNARARNWPRRPTKHAIAAVQGMALRVPGWRRTGLGLRALPRVSAPAGQVPTPSPERIRLRANCERRLDIAVKHRTIRACAADPIIYRLPSCCRYKSGRGASA